jgi:acetyl-CoA C-acetyltransferase
MAGDEGISHSTPEGLAKLKPVMPGGSVTFGGQTHPADGNAASSSPRRERRGNFPPTRRSPCACTASASPACPWLTCPRPPCRRRSARWRRPASIAEMKAIKTHNPFAVNDLFFAGRPAAT